METGLLPTAIAIGFVSGAFWKAIKDDVMDKEFGDIDKEIWKTRERKIVSILLTMASIGLFVLCYILFLSLGDGGDKVTVGQWGCIVLALLSLGVAWCQDFVVDRLLETDLVKSRLGMDKEVRQ